MADTKKKPVKSNCDESITSMKYNYIPITDVIAHTDRHQDFSKAFRALKLTKESVMGFLSCPTSNLKNLIAASHVLYYTSGYYKQLIQYFASMATFNWTVNIDNLTDKVGREQEPNINEYDGIPRKEFVRKWTNVVRAIDKLSLKSELEKLFLSVFKEGAYFGFLVEDSKSAFFRQLPATGCHIVGIQDGSYIFEFDLSSVNPLNVLAYPEYIREQYSEWSSNKRGANARVLLPPEKTICIKTDPDTPVICPYFLYLFMDIFDVNEYKAMQKVDGELDNFRAVALEVPVDTNPGQVDLLQVSQPKVVEFTGLANAALPESISVFPTPFKPTFLQAETSGAAKENTAAATNDLYRNAGVMLFNTTSSVAIKHAIEANATIVYGLLRQVERWLNRRLKLTGMNTANVKFEIQFLDQTRYNAPDVSDRYRAQIERGVPVLMEYAASVGATPNVIEGKHFVQNEVFNFIDKWKVPKTSFTQTGKEATVGAEQKNEDDLTDAGVQTREVDGNNPDLRA